MQDSKLTFSKIVATPTDFTWSQAYNAGGLFAVFSLSKQEQDTPLQTLGKQLIDTLEEEYFTLEEKNLESIQEALKKTYQKIPQGIEGCIVVGSIIQSILYAYVYRNGKVLLKRGDKLATLLSKEIEEDLSFGSGFLKNDDIITLQTHAFSQIISLSSLSSSIDSHSPTEIAEIITPKIHEQQKGDAAAIIIAYKDVLDTQDLEVSEEPSLEEIIHQEKPLTTKSIQDDFFDFFKNLNFQNPTSNLKLLKKKHIYLFAAILLFLFFLGSIFLTTQTKQNAQKKSLFEKTIGDAQKKFDEGKTLLPLNKNLARDDFKDAEKTLLAQKDTFKKGSTEEKGIQNLLQQVQEMLSSSSQTIAVKAVEIPKDSSLFLFLKLTHPQELYAQDDSTVYQIFEKSVKKIDKKSKQEKEIPSDKPIPNTTAFAAYGSNIYVVDKANDTVVKLINTGEKYVTQDYFSPPHPSVASSVAITINGSVWILGNDGSVTKYLRGKQENFHLSGLDKPLRKPNKITTTIDSKFLYVLDNENGRIVVLDKNGAYNSQYQSNVLKSAKDFEVKEEDKKIFVLSGGKIWEIGIK